MPYSILIIEAACSEARHFWVLCDALICDTALTSADHLTLLLSQANAAEDAAAIEGIR